MNKKIIRAKIDLMLTQPFWGSLITRLELRDWKGPTFATNGRYLYVPEDKYYKDWSFKQIVGVLAHETFHCAGGHVFRVGNRNHIKWNFAADFATNLLLKTNGFELPKGCLLDDKFKGMTAEKIYNLLPNPPVGDCPLDLLDPGKDKAKDVPSSGLDPKELEQEWKEAVTSAARLAKGRGNMPGGIEEYIEAELFPKVPWQQILYRYLQTAKGNTDFTAYPFDRRHIWREVFLPSMQGESIEIVCTVDTSGSIDKSDLERYFSEIRGICTNFGQYTIYLFQHDTNVSKEEIITEDSPITQVAVGRGGTSHVPVFEKIEEENLQELPIICFTDLDTEFPRNWIGDSVFWLIRKNQNHHSKEVPFGQKIEIDD